MPGFQTFVAGSVLTASDVNSYLMQQVNIIFLNEATRDAAIPSPVEGQQCYLTAPTVPAATGTTTGVPTGVRVIYNGSAWVCTTPVGALSNTSASTTSTSYVTTLSGDATAISTTLVTGTTAHIQFGGRVDGSTLLNAQMTFSVSGATTVAASDTNGTLTTIQSSTGVTSYRSCIFTGLTAGTNVFTLNYKTSGGTLTCVHRNLVVCGVA